MNLTERNITETAAPVIHSFGIKDAKGREIGARITLQTIEYVALPEDATCGYRREPGVVLCYTFSATRDGKDYGATQPTKHCKSEADRQASIQAYLEGARARAAGKGAR